MHGATTKFINYINFVIKRIMFIFLDKDVNKCCSCLFGIGLWKTTREANIFYVSNLSLFLKYSRNLSQSWATMNSEFFSFFNKRQ